MTATVINADDRKAEDVIVITTTDQQQGQMPINWRSKVSPRTKKRAILVLALVCMFAVGVAGILIALKFFLDNNKEIVEWKYELEMENGKKMKENVKADIADNLVQYHTQNDDSETWVINDFNRLMQIVKSKQQMSFSCFVSQLNVSNAAAPEFIKNASQPVGTVATTKSYYQASAVPIKDKSILGTEGAKLCENMDVYWITKKCDAQDQQNSNSTVRQKRWLTCDWYYDCEYYCDWYWGYCYWYCGYYYVCYYNYY